MTSGTRVVHREKPEYGYGLIKFEETDVLGDQQMLHVSFEHLDHPLTLSPDDVTPIPDPSEDAAGGRWGDLQDLRRRVCCGLVLAENNLTGSFLRTMVQPLPHQAALLDKVLSGQRLGHLFADDVGLGKTIEAGLLITATLCSKPQARIMVVCPAGLSLQWQEEMDEHFSLHFEILGINFVGARSANWQNHRLIIAPIDTIKRAEYIALFQQIDPFDLIVCDEAHRLNAHRDRLTNRLAKTRNYELFESLVQGKSMDFISEGGAPRSPRMVFLSATPHQGDDLRFLYLLNLLRPDLFPIDGEDTALLVADRMKEVVTRTPKSVARDWDGKPIFKGHTSLTLDLKWTADESKLSADLTSYIIKAVSAAQGGSRATELIVALVMHTFHKIAASSWRALSKTLRLRLAVIEGNAKGFGQELETGNDERDEGLDDAKLDQAFYEEEPEALRILIHQIETLPSDEKWEKCKTLLTMLETREPGCRVLFFTQFKETQKYLAESLISIFPGSMVEIINGDVPLEERRTARQKFETTSRFMVSTEAGGEGVNLQRACHIMVNYDWPWNPMRLQQRIGRLDRYGQKQVVQVYNLRVPDSWDAKISMRIEERLAVIQTTMGEVVASDIEDYRYMIVGQVADKIDAGTAFVADVKGKGLSQEKLDEMLKEAIESKRRWKERFGDHLRPSLGDPQLRPTLGSSHLKDAYSAALESKGIKLQETRTSENQFVPGVYHFELPDEFRDSRIRASRRQYVAFDRERFASVREVNLGTVRGQPIVPGLAGFGDSFTDWLFQSAMGAETKPRAYVINAPEGWSHGQGWVAIFCLRYVGAGRRMTAPDELIGVTLASPSEAIKPADLFLLAAQGTSPLVTMEGYECPPLSGAETVARNALRERIRLRGGQTRVIPGLTLWAIINVS